MAKATRTLSAPLSKRNEPSPQSQPLLDPAKVPDIYAMTVDGDCMLPEIVSGARLMFHRTECPAPGDLVAIYFGPGHIPSDGYQIWVKRLVIPPPSYVRFPYQPRLNADNCPSFVVKRNNPPAELWIKCSQVLGLHKCLGFVPADAVTYKWKATELARLVLGAAQDGR